MASAIRYLAVLTTLALAGCGGGSQGDEDAPSPMPAPAEETNAVRFVLADLQAASRDGDGDRICNQIFTPRLADSVTAASKGGSCAKQVRRNLFSRDARIVVQDVTLRDPTSAVAVVAEQGGSGSDVLLAKQGGEWRIRSVRPR